MPSSALRQSCYASFVRCFRCQPVCSSTTSVGLSTLSEVLRLSTEGTLVNFSFLRPRLEWVVSYWRTNPSSASGATHKWTTIVFQFNDRRRCLPGHVVDSILIAQPVGSLHGVVHVPPPVVLVHVSQRRIDATLCRHSVGSSGKEFGDAGGVEASFCQTKCCSQTRSSGTNHDRIVLMVLSQS